jgi:hypothetical protein
MMELFFLKEKFGYESGRMMYRDKRGFPFVPTKSGGKPRMGDGVLKSYAYQLKDSHRFPSLDGRG